MLVQTGITEFAIKGLNKSRWVDNVVVERLWHSVKYEEVYLHAYESIMEAHSKIGGYLEFYNTEREH